MREGAICGLAILIAAGSTGASCRHQDGPPPHKTPQMIWRTVGTWSGSGSRQTESFTSDTGALRVRWETRQAAGDGGGGTFRLTAHSAISGRILQQVVDEDGAGSGVDYVSQDPHVFYLSVESAGVNWKFSVDEGIAGEVVGSAAR